MPDAGKNGQCWKRRTGLEKKLIFGASILGALALIFLLIVAFRKSCETAEVDEECSTKYCVKAAAELLDYIDLKQDPCENFYRYTCGSYYKHAVKKDSPSPWTSTATLLKNELKGLVVDPVKPKDASAHIALKQFYHECMNETKIDEDGNESFMDAIDELGGWPMINGTNWDAASFDWADWYIKAKQMGLPVIGFFNFRRIEAGGNNTILRVTGPNLDSDSHLRQRHFTDLMKQISQAFGVHNHKQDHLDIYKFIAAIYKYREELEPDDEGHEDDDDDDDDDDNDDDDDGDDDDEDHNHMLPTIQNLTEICPDVPWLKILNGISGNPSQFNSSSVVVYYQNNIEKYCASLGKLLNETHPKVIANYYIWSIIQNAHKYMDKHIRRAYQDATDEDDDRFTICFDATNERFKWVKETIYVRKKTNPEVRAQLQEMIDIMKDLFVEHLKECDWMDDTTRVAAMEKAQLIESVIGADDELYDTDIFDKILGVDQFNFTSDNMFEMFQQKMIKEDHHFFETLYGPIPDNWESFFKNAVEVNAFFLPSVNVMIIPAPILTSIFFNRKFPAFMNYGPMESTIGHEFMHGFGKDSREVLLENGTTIDWWTNATAEMFDKKVQCVIDEYENIPFRYQLNGTLTLEENVADYVGADLGYEAYKRYVKKHGAEKKLAGVPLTPEQIYWVQTGTNFCFRKLDDNEVDYEEEDAHAIPKFRIQAPARNSKHFAEAFNCPPESFMNPKEKCRIL